MRRPWRAVVLVCVLGPVAAALPAEAARYRYGRTAAGDASGFFVQLEGGPANPRDTDAVVATIESVEDFGGGTNALTPVLPVWDEEIAGRVSVGYQWASGNRVSASYWSFSADQSAAGDGPASGRLHFAVGPPIFTGGDYVGDNASPGFFDLTTEIDASTADLTWGRAYAVSEGFTLDWSLGLRLANYEETTSGIYDEVSSSDANFGGERYAAFKSNEGEMIGARATLGGSFRLGRSFSLDGVVGLSFLDGELTAHAQLEPSGIDNQPVTPRAVADETDDGRSGRIVDLETTLAWHAESDRWRFYVGWRQSLWEGIARDLVRNFAGTSAPLDDRPSVTFSGYVLGAYYRF